MPFPTNYPAGSSKRVAIARARSPMRPKLMLYDEPTSALDPEMIREVLDVMANLRRGRHDEHCRNPTRWDLHVAPADRIVFMESGEIIESAPSEQFLRRHPSTSAGRRFPRPDPSLTCCRGAC